MASTIITQVCADCDGTQELETGNYERETGCAITYKCPFCEDGTVETEIEAPDICFWCNETPCVCDDAYAAADGRFTSAYEES